jgi:integrase
MPKYNPNTNHPKKGRRIKVEPIRELKDIRSIKQLLKSRPRDYLLFVMGISTGLRAGDLLKLKVADVAHLSPGQSIRIRRGRDGRDNTLTVSRDVHRAIRDFIETVRPGPEDFLFASQKGRGPLTIQALNAMVKRWTRAIDLQGNFGAQTLRMTYEFTQAEIIEREKTFWINRLENMSLIERKALLAAIKEVFQDP